MDPFAPVLGGRVHLQRLVVEGARHEDREHLLGELIGPVVVGAVRDRHGQAVRLVVGAHRVVGARLRRVVRRPGPVRRRLGEQVFAVEREVAVHLARRDVMEASDPDRARRLEQRLRPDDVGAEEQARVEDGQAVVRLGGEVHDDVDRLAPEHLLGELVVGDVALHERDVPGVRQEVEHDGVVARMVLDPEPREVRSDEAGAAGHENVHGRSMFAGPCAGATAARSPCGAGSTGRASTGSGRRRPSRRRSRGRPTRRRARRRGCSSSRRGT